MPLSHWLLNNLDPRVAFEKFQERRLAATDVAFDVDGERDVVDVVVDPQRRRRRRRRRRLRRRRHRRQGVGRRENENEPCEQFTEIHLPVKKSNDNRDNQEIKIFLYLSELNRHRNNLFCMPAHL